jgi:hypothetical protein
MHLAFNLKFKAGQSSQVTRAVLSTMCFATESLVLCPHPCAGRRRSQHKRRGTYSTPTSKQPTKHGFLCSAFIMLAPVPEECALTDSTNLQPLHRPAQRPSRVSRYSRHKSRCVGSSGPVSVLEATQGWEREGWGREGLPDALWWLVLWLWAAPAGRRSRCLGRCLGRICMP